MNHRLAGVHKTQPSVFILVAALFDNGFLHNWVFTEGLKVRTTLCQRETSVNAAMNRPQPELLESAFATASDLE